MALRLGLDPGQALIDGKNVAEKIAELEEFRQAKSVGLYSPLKGEIDIFSLHKKAFLAGKIICYPKVQKDHIDFYQVDDPHKLVLGAFGIMEPAEYSKVVSPGEIDLLVVPGVCFDRQGNRIGFGKGFYDRYLAGYDGTSVGCCYACQLVEKIETSDHDVPVDILILPD